MASLKKPKLCGCGGKEFKHLFKPERWVCVACNVIVAERQQRIAGVCNKCGVSEDEKKFKKGKNLCLDCFNIYMQEWRKKNPGWDSDPKFKQKRMESVKRCIEKSPQSFIKHLWQAFTRPSRLKGKRNSMHINPKRLAILNTIEIDLDFLLSLYADQRGLCALSGLPMSHEFNDLCSISVDRVDSTKGYIPGNVQLVCKWVNLAKQKHSNAEFLELLDTYYSFRRERDAGLNNVELLIRER